MKKDAINYVFVDAIPEALEERTIYVAIDFATVVHKCCCGCGQEVVTPLSPTDWKIIYDGVSVSLSPSIGNWNFPCQSHYWIVRNEIRWAAQWTPEQIVAGRAADRRNKRIHCKPTKSPTQPTTEPASQSILSQVWRWIFGK